MLVDGLAQLIPANATIATALGIPRSDTTTGVFPNTAPDEVVLPYIVYMQMSRSTILAYPGVNRFQSARFRFSCYGASYRQTKVLVEDLKLLLDGYVGVLPDGTLVENTIPGLELDSSEAVFHGTVYGTHLDYTFQFIDGATFNPTVPSSPVGIPVVFTAMAGQTDFILPTIPPGEIQLFYNGQLIISPGDYSLSVSDITLSFPAMDGDILVAYY